MYVKLTVADLGFPVGGVDLVGGAVDSRGSYVAPATPPSRFANDSVWDVQPIICVNCIQFSVNHKFTIHYNQLINFCKKPW